MLWPSSSAAKGASEVSLFKAVKVHAFSIQQLAAGAKQLVCHCIWHPTGQRQGQTYNLGAAYVSVQAARLPEHQRHVDGAGGVAIGKLLGRAYVQVLPLAAAVVLVGLSRGQLGSGGGHGVLEPSGRAVLQGSWGANEHSWCCRAGAAAWMKRRGPAIGHRTRVVGGWTPSTGAHRCGMHFIGEKCFGCNAMSLGLRWGGYTVSEWVRHKRPSMMYRVACQPDITKPTSDEVMLHPPDSSATSCVLGSSECSNVSEALEEHCVL